MIKKKCKECGTLIDPHSQEYCEICHGNHGWWYTCDKHQDLIFREEKKECPVCKLLARIAEASQPEPTTAKAPAISIHDAAEKGDIEAVKQYLAAGTDVKAMDKRGRTPLHFAAKRGQKELVELLIANGADVNAKSEKGTTPLHYAAIFGHKEIAQLLITKGADVNAEDKVSATPLDFSIFRNHSETADLLRKHGGKTGEELKAGCEYPVD